MVRLLVSRYFWLGVSVGGCLMFLVIAIASVSLCFWIVQHINVVQEDGETDPARLCGRKTEDT